MPTFTDPSGASMGSVVGTATLGATTMASTSAGLPVMPPLWAPPPQNSRIPNRSAWQQPLRRAGDTSSPLLSPGVTTPTQQLTGAPYRSTYDTYRQQQQQQQRSSESMLQWRKPQLRVSFREWYMYHYCNDQSVRFLDGIQRMGYPFRSLITFYFKLWSFTGEAEFYVLFIPTLVWLGTALDGVQIASMLCLGQFITGTMKDAMCCPRPPCPPLELRGKRKTHDEEYGFPSTHSSHSAVFAYFLYSELVRFFPESAVICWCIAVIYWVNVCLSRLYLGMHWVGDLMGGWAVAILCILFHVSFLDRWTTSMLLSYPKPWWVYPLPYLVFHLLAVWHAAPHDPCPCYVDSLRFAGVILGSFYGFFIFQAQYHTLTARPTPEGLCKEAFSWSFAKQWTVCIILTVVAKELSSLIAGKLLKVMFKVLAGTYAGALPPPIRGGYLVMARMVGYTTSGNARNASDNNSRAFSPTVGNDSFSVIASGGGVGGTTGGPTSTAASVRAPTLDGTTTVAATPQSIHVGQRSPMEIVIVTAPNRVRSSPGCSPTPTSTAPVTVEEIDGYLSAHQVWSLRTHEHWWLWDAHKRTVSYAVTGFFVTYVCPVLLREYFGVGKTTGASTAQLEV